MANENHNNTKTLFIQDIEPKKEGKKMKNPADQQYLDFIEHRDNYQYFPSINS